MRQMDLEQTMAEHGDCILRLCFLILRDRAAAEDAAQETFLRAWQSWERFDGRAAVKTWLTSIAVNVCRHQLRSPWRRRRVDWETLGDLAAPEQHAEDGTVLRAVLSLPKKYREIVVLHYYQGFSTPEIARMLCLPTGTVSVRLMRARERLKPMLKEWYYEEA